MRFAHLTLATRDVPAAAQFFEQALLWQPIHRPGNIDREAAWLQIAPCQQLHLVFVEDFSPSPFEREFGRHVAIFYPGEEFAALRERLETAGGEVLDAIRPTPFARFFFRSPDGYVFEVIDRQGYQTEE